MPPKQGESPSTTSPSPKSRLTVAKEGRKTKKVDVGDRLTASGTVYGIASAHGRIRKTATQSRSTRVVFEILPSSSPFEPTTSESLVRLRERCNKNDINLYDMSAGQGANVSQLDEGSEEVKKELHGFLEVENNKNKEVPNWMKEINKNAFAEAVKAEPEVKFTREKIYSLEGRPNVAEYHNAVMVQPYTVPVTGNSHTQLDSVPFYCLNSTASQNVLTKKRILDAGEQGCFQTTRDLDLDKPKTRDEIRRALDYDSSDMTGNEKAFKMTGTALRAGMKFIANRKTVKN